MKKIIYTLFAISLFHPFAISQWLQQVSGITDGLQDCDFINQNTGWVCGNNGVILKTTNGGVNWFQQSSGVSKILWGIDAVDENLLWCVGQWNTILKSTDGGNNWIVLRDGPTSSPTFRKVFFLNTNAGWLLKSNYILRTTNGGTTFDSTNTVFTFLWDIYFKDALTGVLCADGARIMKSTDGGVIWNLITIPLYQGEQPNFYRLSFVNNSFGWTVGEGDNSGLGKLVFRTTNFGSNWDTIGRVQYPNNEFNYSVFFPSLSTGYCGGTSGFTYKTTNGGFSWNQQVVPSNSYRGDFYFVNDSVGWSIGGGGHIFKTTNGGTYVSVEPISSLIPENFKLYQNYPNPFNPVTNVIFEIAFEDNVEIIVYDILGRKVEILVNEKLNTGKYKVNFRGDNLSSGIYICKLITSKFQESKTMVLIK
ncbi:MAG: YCF48-related protein [Chlorobi bacterium]|nr:YCF48-related protein [Chlorobiota bacterium]MCI0715428.1 YCF48-related protein [Chlorobiota bacterium]